MTPAEVRVEMKIVTVPEMHRAVNEKKIRTAMNNSLGEYNLDALDRSANKLPTVLFYTSSSVTQ